MLPAELVSPGLGNPRSCRPAVPMLWAPPPLGFVPSADETAIPVEYDDASAKWRPLLDLACTLHAHLFLLGPCGGPAE